MRIVLSKNRFPAPRFSGFASFACALLLVSASAMAQTSSSSSSSSTAAPGTAQAPTTAAPGTAPIRSRSTALRINPLLLPTYTEKWEVYGGLSFMNGQAGQNLPKRYNMGGGEVMATYWLRNHLGVSGDYRFEAGTTDLIPTAKLANTRALVYQNILAGGVTYRGPKNRYAAIDFHALAGATHGQFDHSIKDDPGIPPGPLQNPTYYGLYNNSTSPWGAVGGSVDFNVRPRWAVRLSPDLIFEHFGTETREFFSISMGALYRFGKR